MTDPRAAPSSRRAAGILVTGASGAVGRAVVDALVAAGETVVAGVRDPRARLADGAKWASGTAAAARGSRPGSPTSGAARPTGKPDRAPNQKPSRSPAHKPVTAPAGASARTIGKPAVGRDEPGAASADHAGASVRGFDFADRGTWASALAGVDRVLLIRPLVVTDVGRSIIPFIDTAMESGVRQVVFVSQLSLPFDTRSPQHAVETYLKRTRAPYTVLRPNELMQVLTTVCRDDIRQRDEIVLPAGRARLALVDARDVARVAVRVLTEPGHLRKTYTLSGEQAVGYQEVAALLSAELGRPITYTSPSEEEYLTLLAKQGTKPDLAAALQAVYKVVRGRGAMRPTRTIRRLTGEPPVTVQRFVEEHGDVWH